MSSILAYGLILYCRPGFEKECASETSALTTKAGLPGKVHAEPQSGVIRFVLNEPVDWRAIADAIPFNDWVFARQRVVWVGRVEDLPTRDRVTPIASIVHDVGIHCGRVWMETADTNDAKKVSGMLKRMTPHLEFALGNQNSLKNQDSLATLHLFFEGQDRVDLGLTMLNDASPWPMGIARLRMPRAAPSRSTLKLAEAFQALMTEDERTASLKAGLRAVDLGAAPGGWSLQFAERGLHVSAVDNGNIAPAVMATGMVEHVRADGFTWRPQRKSEWMVCDMVEQPTRIAALVADWIASGRCRRSIFNLKLPMKKRIEELAKCRKLIDQRMRQLPGAYTLRFKHLYHDREEITGYLAK
ncbi:MAG TPA: 23S rRNA (cytidine(2498)-2'-O)-methyltransferase RlmM [Rhodocyclaceae bacterium]|nr:23S rRNA (cytidine(2498)-2'-O)-methyltransferase RlmM [Rhodocyclaceae bacterium]